MKTKLPVIRRGVSRTRLLLSAVLFLMATGSQATVTWPPAPGKPTSGRDTILVHKSQVSKKNKIRLYPNDSHQVLFFSASGESGKVFQLFLFDVDGKLVKQVNVRNKQTTIVNRMSKGSYLFEVFSDDERIENGQVIIK